MLTLHSPALSAQYPTEMLWLVPSSGSASLSTSAAARGRSARHGERNGGCRSHGGNTGSYDKEWSLSEGQCRARCADFGSCLAYEFERLQSGYTRCEFWPLCVCLCVSTHVGLV